MSAALFSLAPARLRLQERCSRRSVTTRASRVDLHTFLLTHSVGELLGWEVVLLRDGSTVGRVSEVASASNGEFVFDVSGSGGGASLDFLTALDAPDAPENVLLRVQAASADYEWSFYLPLAPALVPSLELASRRLLCAPPEGLLEQAEQAALLAWLGEQFVQMPSHRPLSPAMPTRAELEAAGRADLVSAVLRAGGWSSVSAGLALKGSRKPSGYWDDVELLSLELQRFVDAHWSRHAAADEQSYLYNDITGEVRWETEESESEEESDFVMPPLAALAAARRWDLVAAVRLHGGQREVTHQLGWLSARRGAGRGLLSLSAIADELADTFWADDSPDGDAVLPRGCMPTAALLLEADRADLLAAVTAQGGIAAVAARLGLRTRRSPLGRWASAELAARALQAHLSRAPALPGRLPSHAALLAAGRADLAYAMTRHGEEVGRRLKLRRSRGRGPRLGFQAAREAARALRLTSQAAWREWSRGGQRPLEMPGDPYTAYRGQGWAGWPDWLGYG